MAKRRVRGVYRTKGKSLRASHVKPNPKLKQYTGGREILKTVGVGHRRVLLWCTVEGTWNANAASHLYVEVLPPNLKKKYRGTKNVHFA